MFHYIFTYLCYAPGGTTAQGSARGGAGERVSAQPQPAPSQATPPPTSTPRSAQCAGPRAPRGPLGAAVTSPRAAVGTSIPASAPGLYPLWWPFPAPPGPAGALAVGREARLSTGRAAAPRRQAPRCETPRRGCWEVARPGDPMPHVQVTPFCNHFPNF